jgi:hypothetical protein
MKEIADHHQAGYGVEERNPGSVDQGFLFNLNASSRDIIYLNIFCSGR